MSHGLQLCVAFLVSITVPSTFHAQEAKGAKELKLIANVSERNQSSVRIKQEAAGIVIRSAEELVAASSKPDSAKDAAVQKEMEVDLAKRLKVESIDWGKQMVVVVQGYGTTGEYGTIKFESLKAEGKTLTIQWKQENRVTLASTLGPPTGLGLLERFEGEVKFVTPAKKDQ